MPYRNLEEKLGYCFGDKSLLKQALTHPSANPRSPHRIVYERMEFLGDAVLELVVSDRLYVLLPEESEGILTKMRARVVSREHLSKIALLLKLDEYIILGKGEEKTGGRTRTSILANTFETIFGAIFLDSDYLNTRAIILTTLDESIKEAASNLQENNPKGELQAILQELYPETPAYLTVENQAGDDQERFQSSVMWRNIFLGSGKGSNKRKAEVAAAAEALDKKLWEKNQPEKHDQDL